MKEITGWSITMTVFSWYCANGLKPNGWSMTQLYLIEVEPMMHSAQRKYKVVAPHRL